jgi:hypothetical protein
MASLSATSETCVLKLTKDVLVFKTGIGIVFCGACLIVEGAFGIIGEHLIGAILNAYYLLTYENLSFAPGLGFLSG